MFRKTLMITTATLLLLFSLIYYLFFTESGKSRGNFLLGYFLTLKSDLDIEVKSLDLSNYPELFAEITVERRYEVVLEGEYRSKRLDINYTITSECIESNICRIDDRVAIAGDIKGRVHDLHIDGKGTLLGGQISYSLLRKRRHFEDISLSLQGANSQKIFALMGERDHFGGESNITLTLPHVGKERREGVVDIVMMDPDYEGIRLDMEAKVLVENRTYRFDAQMRSGVSVLELHDGLYHQESKKAQALYRLSVPNALELAPLLAFDFNTTLESRGVLSYDEKLRIEGDLSHLGGEVKMEYIDKMIAFSLKDVGTTSLFEKLAIEPLFDSNLSGEGRYDVGKKHLLFDGRLSDLTFNPSSLTQDIYRSLEYNLSKELFTNNQLRLETRDEKLYSELNLTNAIHHMWFGSSSYNSKRNTFSTQLDIALDRYYAKGDLLFKIDRYTKARDLYLDFDGVLQKHYEVTLHGMVSPKWISMDYTLGAKRLPSHICTIEDDVNLSGHIAGVLKRPQIEAKGVALNGDIAFRAIKNAQGLENIELQMHNIHALKLSTLLGLDQIPSGRADINASFEHLSLDDKKGELTYRLREARYKTLPLLLETTIEMEGARHSFKSDITLANMKLMIERGLFGESNQSAKAFYTIDAPKLATMEPILGGSYRGSFYGVGELWYADEKFKVHGLSKSFGGLTEYHYENDHWAIDLYDSSLGAIMGLFIDPLIDAKSRGQIDYDTLTGDIEADAKLTHARFIYSDLVENTYQEAGIYLMDEQFDDANITLTYQKPLLKGGVRLSNDRGHIRINSVVIDTKLKSVNGFFDVNLQGRAFSGKVYGALDKPKINLNMQKLIRHEMDRQLDSFVGKSNRKMMESMPMGDLSKDMASGVGGAFMEMFF
jgi:hypothetical protein